MSEILTQAEIEALLASLSETDREQASTLVGTPLTEPAGARRKGMRQPSIGYEVYDFRRPDKFSKEQLRTLQMLHETFARLAGSQLSGFLRTPVTVDLVSLEQVPYEEYLRSINQSVFTILSLPPLSGQTVMEIEFPLIFTMIDRLLGGPGRSVDRAMLTDIERPLLRQVLERLFIPFKSAWEGVVILNPGIEAIETSAQFVQIAPPTDIVVTILFEVRVAGMRGAMSLCVPYLVLKPITTKLSAQKWFVTSARRPNAQVRRQIAGHLRDVSVDCALLMGRTHVTIGDFLALQVGDVLRLDQKENRDIVLQVNGAPKFLGRPALNGRRLAFTATARVEPEID